MLATVPEMMEGFDPAFSPASQHPFSKRKLQEHFCANRGEIAKIVCASAAAGHGGRDGTCNNSTCSHEHCVDEGARLSDLQAAAHAEVHTSTTKPGRNSAVGHQTYQFVKSGHFLTRRDTPRILCLGNFETDLLAGISFWS
eukprot:3717131-Rhodomonas_salina.8